LSTFLVFSPILFVLAASGIAQAGTIAIYSTGFSSTGTNLLEGQHDGNWTITSKPGGGTSVPFVTNGYFPPPLTFLNSGPFAAGWIGDSLASAWISPRATESGSSDASGNYTYQESFYLDPAFFTTAVIAGQWAADNTGDIFINGTQVILGQDGSIPLGTTGAFNHFTSFTLNFANAGFVAGMNTIQFVVNNNTKGTPNTTGLDVDFTSTFVVPEPGTFALMGLGLSTFSYFAIKRRKE
jgi:hypothetical protein